jgi:hypothetical protein
VTLPESLDKPQDDPSRRAAGLLAEALAELLRRPAASKSSAEASPELAAIEALAARFEEHAAAEAEQRLKLAGQLTNLATALDRLVAHLEGLTEVIRGLAAEPPVADDKTASVTMDNEGPRFMPGGEGVSLSVAALPGFQALMEIQKALNAHEAVASASVERFQEGDSRLLVHLESPISAPALAKALRAGTNLDLAVEDARPELMSLRLKVV